MIGTTIANFRIEQVLGQGGMGMVYKARDLRLNRPVALKMLHPHHSNNPSFVKRFENEAMITAQISHPNVATLFDVVDHPNGRILVMEYVSGKTLETLLNEQNKFSVTQAEEYLVQMSHALSKAHSMGIIHRDLKPSNIMITPEGRVKVMDFGIARLKGSARLTAQHNVIGTLQYLSPGLIRGEEPSPASDWYALGVIHHQMLTGKIPFPQLDEAALIACILAGNHAITEAPTSSQKHIAQLLAGQPVSIKNVNLSNGQGRSSWMKIKPNFPSLPSRMMPSIASTLSKKVSPAAMLIMTAAICVCVLAASSFTSAAQKEASKETVAPPALPSIDIQPISNTLPFVKAAKPLELPEFEKPIATNQEPADKPEEVEKKEKRHAKVSERLAEETPRLSSPSPTRKLTNPVQDKKVVQSPPDLISEPKPAVDSARNLFSPKTILNLIKSGSKRKIALPEMRLKVELMEDINPNTHRRGNTFIAKCMAPVVYDGLTVIESGAPVRGVIRKARSAKGQRDAVLMIDLVSIECINGKWLPIISKEVRAGGKDPGFETGYIFSGATLAPTKISVTL
ncbi:MAG: serine/threonine protein kinase [Saprospiraceae bacterium]|nr:serine/threonine protein kinase [Saprospiraceae bacterium]